MAQWGIAISRWTNPMAAGIRPPAQLKGERRPPTPRTRLGATATERERGYINAVSQLYADYEHVDQRTRVARTSERWRTSSRSSPQDTEAKIFYAIALTASAPPTDKTYANQLKAGAILEPIWAVQPNHPGLATTSSTRTTSRHWRARRRQQRNATRRSLRLPRTRCTCHHTRSRASGSGRKSVETNLRSEDVALRDTSIAEALHASD
jgi:hypothetical protein